MAQLDPKEYAKSVIDQDPDHPSEVDFGLLETGLNALEISESNLEDLNLWRSKIEKLGDPESAKLRSNEWERTIDASARKKEVFQFSQSAFILVVKQLVKSALSQININIGDESPLIPQLSLLKIYRAVIYLAKERSVDKREDFFKSMKEIGYDLSSLEGNDEALAMLYETYSQMEDARREFQNITKSYGKCNHSLLSNLAPVSLEPTFEDVIDSSISETAAAKKMEAKKKLEEYQKIKKNLDCDTQFLIKNPDAVSKCMNILDRKHGAMEDGTIKPPNVAPPQAPPQQPKQSRQILEGKDLQNSKQFINMCVVFRGSRVGRNDSIKELERVLSISKTGEQLQAVLDRFIEIGNIAPQYRLEGFTTAKGIWLAAQNLQDLINEKPLSPKEIAHAKRLEKALDKTNIHFTFIQENILNKAPDISQKEGESKQKIDKPDQDLTK